MMMGVLALFFRFGGAQRAQSPPVSEASAPQRAQRGAGGGAGAEAGGLGVGSNPAARNWPTSGAASASLGATSHRRPGVVKSSKEYRDGDLERNSL